jgi:hypothetical protein
VIIIEFHKQGIFLPVELISSTNNIVGLLLHQSVMKRDVATTSSQFMESGKMW